MRGFEVDASAIVASSAGCKLRRCWRNDNEGLASTSRALGQKRLLSYADDGSGMVSPQPSRHNAAKQPKPVPFLYQSGASAYMLCLTLDEHYSDASQALNF